jgi:hypothetical protein
MIKPQLLLQLLELLLEQLLEQLLELQCLVNDVDGLSVGPLRWRSEQLALCW